MADIKLQTIPVGPLGIIAMKNIEPLAKKAVPFLFFLGDADGFVKKCVHIVLFQYSKTKAEIQLFILI